MECMRSAKYRSCKLGSSQGNWFSSRNDSSKCSKSFRPNGFTVAIDTIYKNFFTSNGLSFVYLDQLCIISYSTESTQMYDQYAKSVWMVTTSRIIYMYTVICSMVEWIKRHDFPILASSFIIFFTFSFTQVFFVFEIRRSHQHRSVHVDTLLQLAAREKQ